MRRWRCGGTLTSDRASGGALGLLRACSHDRRCDAVRLRVRGCYPRGLHRSSVTEMVRATGGPRGALASGLMSVVTLRPESPERERPEDVVCVPGGTRP